MSKHHIEKVTCPSCNAEGEFLLWESINTTLDPEMKIKVRNGEAFKYKCEKCGNIAAVNYSTLYHQMEDHIMIQLNLGDNLEESIEFMKGIFRNSDGEIVELDIKLDDDYQNRVVTSMNTFKEKLNIIDYGLDDKVIELMKLFMLAQLGENNPDVNVLELLFDINESGAPLFAVHMDDGKWGTTSYPQDLYDYIKEKFAAIIENDKEVVIDLNWAMEILKSEKE